MPQTPTQPAVDLSDVQGGIFKDYEVEFEKHLFFAIGSVDAGRAFVRAVRPWVTNAKAQEQAADTRLNLGFTWPGLDALGVEDAALASFPVEFREGMAARAGLLGDNGPSAPGQWDPPLGERKLHVWVLVQAARPEDLTGRRDEVLAMARASGAIELICEQDGAGFGPAHAPAREHFGFMDGIGQPGVEGVGCPVHPGTGTPREGGGWVPIPVGCFLLGYPDAYGRTATRPKSDVLRHNGTYMAYRKLEQDVVRFRDFIDANAHVVGGDKELLAAKMVGRWRSGAPLELAPDRDDPALAADPQRNNDFRYFDDDRRGEKVPHSSHIRRTNPRDRFLEKHAGVIDPGAHRIIRRSKPYGPWLPEGAEDDDERRGIHFRAFNANLMDQFEVVQAVWTGSANESFGLSSDRDPIAGSNETMGPESRRLQATFSIPRGQCVATLYDLPRFVTVKGGDYFFVPSLKALDSLGAPVDAPERGTR